jgi:hypothetical protein
LPSTPAFVVAAVFAFAAVTASARAWVALFSDIVVTRAARAYLRGTFYLAQLTKYLPVGGVVQAASQVGLARSVGVPLKRSAVALPVSIAAAVAAGGTLGCGLVFSTDAPNWARVIALAGLSALALLYLPLLAWLLEFSRRFVKRIPTAEELPTQRDILIFYAWALVTLGSLSIEYTVLLRSITHAVNPYTMFCAFAISWVVGYLAIPIPAGVGVREAVLVALMPGVGTAELLAASLAARLVSIGAEVMTFGVNKLVSRRHVSLTVGPDRPEPTEPLTDTAPA